MLFVSRLAIRVLPRSLGARRLRAGRASLMWNEMALRRTVANAGTIHGREGANEDAAVVVVARAVAGDDACEVRAPRPRFAKGELVAAADAVAYLDACLTLGSLLRK